MAYSSGYQFFMSEAPSVLHLRKKEHFRFGFDSPKKVQSTSNTQYHSFFVNIDIEMLAVLKYSLAIAEVMPL